MSPTLENHSFPAYKYPFMVSPFKNQHKLLNKCFFVLLFILNDFQLDQFLFSVCFILFLVVHYVCLSGNLINHFSFYIFNCFLLSLIRNEFLKCLFAILETNHSPLIYWFFYQWLFVLCFLVYLFPEFEIFICLECICSNEIICNLSVGFFPSQFFSFMNLVILINLTIF